MSIPLRLIVMVLPTWCVRLNSDTGSDLEFFESLTTEPNLRQNPFHGLTREVCSERQRNRTSRAFIALQLSVQPDSWNIHEDPWEEILCPGLEGGTRWPENPTIPETREVSPSSGWLGLGSSESAEEAVPVRPYGYDDHGNIRYRVHDLAASVQQLATQHMHASPLPPRVSDMDGIVHLPIVNNRQVRSKMIEQAIQWHCKTTQIIGDALQPGRQSSTVEEDTWRTLAQNHRDSLQLGSFFYGKILYMVQSSYLRGHAVRPFGNLLNESHEIANRIRDGSPPEEGVAILKRANISKLFSMEDVDTVSLRNMDDRFNPNREEKQGARELAFIATSRVMQVLENLFESAWPNEADPNICYVPAVLHTQNGTCVQSGPIGVGSSCTPKCDDGYEPSEVSLDCHADGSLSPPTFTCRAPAGGSNLMPNASMNASMNASTRSSLPTGDAESVPNISVEASTATANDSIIVAATTTPASISTTTTTTTFREQQAGQANESDNISANAQTNESALLEDRAEWPLSSVHHTATERTSIQTAQEHCDVVEGGEPRNMRTATVQEPCKCASGYTLEGIAACGTGRYYHPDLLQNIGCSCGVDTNEHGILDTIGSAAQGAAQAVGITHEVTEEEQRVLDIQESCGNVRGGRPRSSGTLEEPCKCDRHLDGEEELVMGEDPACRASEQTRYFDPLPMHNKFCYCQSLRAAELARKQGRCDYVTGGVPRGDFASIESPCKCPRGEDNTQTLVQGDDPACDLGEGEVGRHFDPEPLEGKGCECVNTGEAMQTQLQRLNRLGVDTITEVFREPTEEENRIAELQQFCSSVAGGTTRHGGTLEEPCKCPRRLDGVEEVVLGEDPACRAMNQTRYFQGELLVGKGCFCESLHDVELDRRMQLCDRVGGGVRRGRTATIEQPCKCPNGPHGEEFFVMGGNLTCNISDRHYNPEPLMGLNCSCQPTNRTQQSVLDHLLDPFIHVNTPEENEIERKQQFCSNVDGGESRNGGTVDAPCKCRRHLINHEEEIVMGVDIACQHLNGSRYYDPEPLLGKGCYCRTDSAAEIERKQSTCAAVVPGSEPRQSGTVDEPCKCPHDGDVYQVVTGHNPACDALNNPRHFDPDIFVGMNCSCQIDAAYTETSAIGDALSRFGDTLNPLHHMELSRLQGMCNYVGGGVPTGSPTMETPCKCPRTETGVRKLIVGEDPACRELTGYHFTPEPLEGKACSCQEPVWNGFCSSALRGWGARFRIDDDTCEPRGGVMCATSLGEQICLPKPCEGQEGIPPICDGRSHFCYFGSPVTCPGSSALWDGSLTQHLQQRSLWELGMLLCDEIFLFEALDDSAGGSSQERGFGSSPPMRESNGELSSWGFTQNEADHSRTLESTIFRSYVSQINQARRAGAVPLDQQLPFNYPPPYEDICEDIRQGTLACPAVEANGDGAAPIQRGYSCPALPEMTTEPKCRARLDSILGFVEVRWMAGATDELPVVLYDASFEGFVNEDGCARFRQKLVQLNAWSASVSSSEGIGLQSCQAEGETVCFDVCHTDEADSVIAYAAVGLDSVRMPDATTSPPIAGAMVSGAAIAGNEESESSFDLTQVAIYLAAGAGVLTVIAGVAIFLTGSSDEEDQAGGDLSQPLSGAAGARPTSSSAAAHDAHDGVIGDSDSDSDDGRAHKKGDAASFVD